MAESEDHKKEEAAIIHTSQIFGKEDTIKEAAPTDKLYEEDATKHEEEPRQPET